mmetsp:Transcript_1310/g.2498  ORF Transcript_1310/g.2498 Transcript_1310/m.2498 type:complete len:159 (+) Transcript_1310:646-1122(+)
MPSSLTKGGRGPKNYHEGDQYNQTAFDRNLQDEIYQMTYANRAMELKKQQETKAELDKFRQARSQAALEDKDKAGLLKKPKPAVLAKDKVAETEENVAVPPVKVKTKTKKKKKRKKDQAKKKSKKQKSKETKDEEEGDSGGGALAGLLGGYGSDDDDS